MTGVAKLTGATTNLGNYWKAINWHKVGAEVKRLQTCDAYCKGSAGREKE